MDKDKLDAGYREEGWGKVTDEAFGGRVRPYQVESGARTVAQYAFDALAKAEVENDALWKRIRDMSIAHDARVTELLAANNREVEARRLARAEVERLREKEGRTLLVFDWAYDDPRTGQQLYARTPDRAEALLSRGIKLTPVYTIDADLSSDQKEDAN